MSIWTLCRQAWTGHYLVNGDLNEAQCVLGFSFGGVGTGPKLQPGASNEDLAGYALQHFGQLPRIFQGEIADAYLRFVPGAYIDRIGAHRQPGRYLDTREVAEQAWNIMKQHGWQTAALLAHGHHLPRVDAVCRKLGISAIVLPGLEKIRFCPDSAQRWTRSRRAWLPREVATILYYRCKGWI
jgi:hypothetical protein